MKLRQPTEQLVLEWLAAMTNMQEKKSARCGSAEATDPMSKISGNAMPSSNDKGIGQQNDATENKEVDPLQQNTDIQQPAASRLSGFHFTWPSIGSFSQQHGY